jgi:type VI secretion system secreted protein Hcp
MFMRSPARVSVLFEALENRMMLSAAPVAHHPRAHPTPAHAAHHAAHKVTTPKVTTPKVNAKPKANATAGDPIYMNWNSQQIPGDVTAAGFAGDIQLNSTQWGVGKAVSSANGTGGNSGNVAISDLVITKTLDKATPKLFDQALNGVAAPEVDILFVAPNTTQPYMEIILNNVLVSGYTMNSSGDVPTESMTLNFTKVQFVYTAQNPAGGTNVITSLPWNINRFPALAGG